MKKALNVLALIHTEWNKKSYKYILNKPWLYVKLGEIATVHQLIFM